MGMMTTTTETPRVWLGCLACYNAGFLIGEWYDVADAAEMTTRELHAAHNITTDDAGNVRGAEVYGPHEELWVMDHEYVGDAGEFGQLECQEIAEAYERVGETQWPAFLAYRASGLGATEWDVVGFEDSYNGEWNSEHEFAEDLAEQIGEVPEESPWPLGYIDWKRATRDLFMSDYTSEPAPGGGVYVFRSV